MIVRTMLPSEQCLVVPSRFQHSLSNERLTCRFQLNRAFTLVEIITVVAILALLISIIFPSLLKASNKAKETKSLANLRAIGIGIEFYLNDNGNKYPLACSSSWTSPFWSESIQSYLPNKVFTGRWANGNPLTMNATLADPLLSSTSHHSLGDYGANSELFAGPIAWPATSTPVSASRISERKSRLVEMISAATVAGGVPTGSWYVNASDIVNNPPATWQASQPNDRKTGNFLCLFADGHTEVIAKTDFLSRKRDLMYVNP